MRVLIATNSGFCDGVKRAMRIALEAAARHGGLSADGPLVHNRQAVELLSLHGVDADADTSDRPVLIRAHGVPPDQRRLWLEHNRDVIDATCLHVARNQQLAKQAAESGLTVVLAGDRDHAEVKAVADSAGADCVIVSTPGEIASAPIAGAPFLLAQTTFNVEEFKSMAAALRRRFPDCRVVDTICRATHDRQAEARALAERADVLVVVGGRHSANTGRLAETGKAAGKPVFLVETADELRKEDFAAYSVAAVISGASTPGWITQEVVNRLRRLGRPTPASRLFALVHPLVESRMTLALAAAGMAMAAQFYVLREIEPALAFAAACYVFFAHTLNRRVPADPEARRLSSVDSFYQSKRGWLLGAAWLGAGLALLVSVRTSPQVFAAYVFALAAALAYARIASSVLGRVGAALGRLHPRYWAMAAGWAVAAALPPVLESGDTVGGAGAMAFVFLVRLGGTLLRDLHDVASDRLMGIDTLPGRFGPLRSLRFAAVILGFAAALPWLAAVLAIWANDAPGAWFLFLLALPASPGIGLWLLANIRKGRPGDAVLLQAGVDAMGMVAGCLALLGGWIV